MSSNEDEGVSEWYYYFHDDEQDFYNSDTPAKRLMLKTAGAIARPPTPENSSSAWLSKTTDNHQFNVDVYLADELGPKSHFDAPFRMFLALFYSLILITGICGNILICYVILRNRVMHTTTNFYILNLSIADLITLITGLPVEIFFLWQQYPWPFGLPLCILRTALFEFAAYNSVMTITAFTTERYTAVCHPFKSASFRSQKSTFRILAIIWIVAGLFSLPFALSARVYAERRYPESNYTVVIQDSLVCNIPSNFHYVMRIAMQISAYLFFLLPMIYVSILYIFIGFRIKHSLHGHALLHFEAPGENQPSDNEVTRSTSCNLSPGTRRIFVDSIRLSKSKKKMSRLPKTPIKHVEIEDFSTASRKQATVPSAILIAIVFAFFVCWFPFHLQRLLSIYSAFSSFAEQNLFYNILFNISGILFYVSPTINPILYSLLSAKFRVAFLESFACGRGAKKSHLLIGDTRTGCRMANDHSPKGNGLTTMEFPASAVVGRFKNDCETSSASVDVPPLAKSPRKTIVNADQSNELLKVALLKATMNEIVNNQVSSPSVNDDDHKDLKAEVTSVSGSVHQSNSVPNGIGNQCSNQNSNGQKSRSLDEPAPVSESQPRRIRRPLSLSIRSHGANNVGQINGPKIVKTTSTQNATRVFVTYNIRSEAFDNKVPLATPELANNTPARVSQSPIVATLRPFSHQHSSNGALL